MVAGIGEVDDGKAGMSQTYVRALATGCPGTGVVGASAVKCNKQLINDLGQRLPAGDVSTDPAHGEIVSKREIAGSAERSSANPGLSEVGGIGPDFPRSATKDVMGGESNHKITEVGPGPWRDVGPPRT